MEQRHAQVSKAGMDPRSKEFAKDFGTFLVTRDHLSELAVERARRAQQRSQERFDLVLTRLGLISESDLAVTLATFLGIPYLSADQFPATALFADKLSAQYLTNTKCIPVEDDGHCMVLAMADPFDEEVASLVAYQVSRKVKYSIALPEDITSAVRRCYGQAAPAKHDSAKSAAQQDGESDVSDDDVRRLLDLASEAPIIKLVHDLIARASALSASDIHLEPQQDSLLVRMRVDGDLRTIESFPPSVTAAVTSRIKIMANLNIAERRLPQGGRIRTSVKGREIDLRVSTMPTMKGESVVLRLLDRATIKLEFSELGMDRATTTQFQELLQTPNGIILVTGPTGSGKTTTLYAALGQLNKPECKIFSIEDPIEYELPGINQIQIQPKIGLTFASILRSVLRQDPDIIMVGEIRDRETAEIAIQAALTGHLVLSTLHTNNAAAAVTRLLDMGIENFLLASSLKGILAQRLVRTVCESCSKPASRSPILQEIIEANGISTNGDQSKVRSNYAKGCAQCDYAGFQGRSMVSEFLLVNDDIKDCIMTNGGEKAITKAATSSTCMVTLFEDGVKKILDGRTTLDEVLRVVRTSS